MDIEVSKDLRHAWKSYISEKVREVLANPMAAKSSMTPRMFNMAFGIRVNFGRGAGHSTFARELLETFPETVLVVPNEVAAQRHMRHLEGDAQERVWVSRVLDIVPQDESTWIRSNVMEKTFEPLAGAKVCVVDDVGRLTVDELELLRAAEWEFMLEMG